MHSQYVGVCNDLPSKNLVNQIKNYTFLTKRKTKKNILIKKSITLLCLQGHCIQDNIIYKCTKLHDHSSIRK